MSVLGRAPATAPLVLLFGLAFLFKPAQLFEANAPFLYFGLAQAALVLVPAFVVASVATAWLASRLGERSQRALAAVVSGIAAAAWVNASFIPSPGGALDGRTVLLAFDEEHVRWNLALWTGMAVGATLLAWRFAQLVRRFFAVLFVLLTLQAVWIAASAEQPWRAPGAGQRLAALSPDKNVLVILLDGFQSDFFAEMLEREPQLERSFPGFTYFANAVGPAPTTYLALPVIHSGVPYREGDGLRDTYRRSVVDGSFMAQFAQSGYDAMLVNPVLNYCAQGVLCDHEDPLVYGRAKSLAHTAAFLVDLGLFRILPDLLKPSVYAEGAWLATRAFADERALTSNRLLEMMTDSLRVESPRPVVRFLHLFNTHAPARLNAECVPVAGLPWLRQTAVNQDRCAVRQVVSLLSRLQALGVYERTAITILADHGAGLPKDRRSAWLLGAYASPLLLAKPFGAQGPLRRSTRLVGLSDVAATLCAWTEDCRMPSGSELTRDTGERHYPFFVYEWRHKYWVAQSVPITDRYEVHGPPAERASWTRLPAQ